MTGGKPRTASESARDALLSLSRPTKAFVAVLTDFLGFAICGVVAFWLISGWATDTSHIALTSAAGALVAVLIAWRRELYRSVIRYIGMDVVTAGVVSAVGSAVTGGVVGWQLSGASGLALRWAAAYSILALIYILGSRYLARAFLVTRYGLPSPEAVIIYGAGDAGAQLATGLQSAGEFNPVAMIDDDRALAGKKVKGLTIFPPSKLEMVTRKTGASRVLLAIPTATRRKRRQVLERLSEFPLHVQTMPEIGDIVSGKARVDDVRDVEVKDLLGRNPIPPNPELLHACIKGKNVMVTGAGGSIGSELCRQILHHSPRKLVLFELSEAALYDVDQQLRRLAQTLGASTEITPLLGSVHHERRIQEVMETFEIHTVYHAAAYKHVPIVEQNLFEGIHNNIFGALHTVRAAIDSGVETFVLISTDKAVNPTNVMGATKRFAELILQAYQAERTGTRLCMVRFGNVLESSGSVVPLFKKQIRSGGPVTVTHRDIIRYFMTIPEAAQLVIQAGSMAQGGDVFVLDMGKPVKIHDLACRMIKLMGLTVRDDANPEGDIEIQYIGLRPAEKLYEELLIGANVSGTEHPRILRADEEHIHINSLLLLLNELMDASLALDYGKARQILLKAVKEYAPRNEIDDLVWITKHAVQARGERDSVIDFPGKKA